MAVSWNARRPLRRALAMLCAALTALSACLGHAPRLGGTMLDPGDVRRARQPELPPDWHVQRNRQNECPRHEPAAYRTDCRGHAWAPDDWLTMRLFHGGGQLGRGYDTYRSAEPGGEGGFQCTYDRNHALVTSGRNRGTYDYVRPEVSRAAHLDSDVEPHERWPRAYEDPDRTFVYECAASREEPRPFQRRAMEVAALQALTNAASCVKSTASTSAATPSSSVGAPARLAQ